MAKTTSPEKAVAPARCTSYEVPHTHHCLSCGAPCGTRQHCSGTRPGGNPPCRGLRVNSKPAKG